MKSGFVETEFGSGLKFEAGKLVTDRGVLVTRSARDLNIEVSELRRWTMRRPFPGMGGGSKFTQPSLLF